MAGGRHTGEKLLEGFHSELFPVIPPPPYICHLTPPRISSDSGHPCEPRAPGTEDPISNKATLTGSGQGLRLGLTSGEGDTPELTTEANFFPHNFNSTCIFTDKTFIAVN